MLIWKYTSTASGKALTLSLKQDTKENTYFKS